jgi:hypothetical protein
LLFTQSIVINRKRTQMANLIGTTAEPQTAGVFGQSTNQTDAAGPGVHGVSRATGALGESGTWHGVAGLSRSTTGGAGVYGQGLSGNIGVLGESTTGAGVEGRSQSGPGVVARSQQGLAILAFGDVEVTGDIRLTNADCAEDFDICDTEQIEPGMVMVLGEDGKLTPSEKAYDKRVAGVVSGAGDYKPGIVLDKQASGRNRQPIALLGKVYCKVDAQCGAIDVGDLLTTSPMPGHAMKADDPAKAFGAVIGKALRPLKEGQGLVPILIALQ